MPVTEESGIVAVISRLGSGQELVTAFWFAFPELPTGDLRLTVSAPGQVGRYVVLTLPDLSDFPDYQREINPPNQVPALPVRPSTQRQ